MIKFQRKFDNSENPAVQGYWDFSFHMLTKKVCEHITEPHKKTALEIGHGGGRLMNAACGYFKHVIGIDIHKDNDMTASFLKKHGRTNFELIRIKSMIPTPTDTIDFVYSFIAIQHLESFLHFDSYICQIYEILKKGGVAQLYYAPCFWKGYEEIIPPPSEQFLTSLKMRPSLVRKYCLEYGFKIIDTGRSYKRVPTGYPNKRGGQRYITVVK